MILYSIPRLHRCHRYGKLLATSTALDRLEIVPEKIELLPTPGGSRLSLGYASVIIPEPIERIRVSRSVVTIDCEKTQFMFWGPHNLERELPPNQETNPVQRALAQEYMTQPFQHLRKVLSVAPVGYSHVFLMVPERSKSMPSCQRPRFSTCRDGASASSVTRMSRAFFT